MITKAIIENFQSHKKTEVEFVPGTNVIIGESDTGKSAIFRAINWVVTNRPLGDAFRSEWGGDTRVRVETSEGHSIERIKGASKNEYIVNGQRLKAFGSEVPEEVENVLQIDQHNIQSQMDFPFLLSDSPGEAAKLLNKAASIDEIDHVISELKKSHDRIVRSIKYNEDLIEDYRVNMQEYSNLEDIEQRVERVESLEKEKDALYQKSEEIKRRISRLRELYDYLDKTKVVNELSQKRDETEKSLHIYKEKERQYQRLCTLHSRGEYALQILSSTEKIPEAIEKHREIKRTYDERSDSDKKVRTLGSLISRARTLYDSLADVENKLSDIEEEYHRIAPDICPLCGNKM